MKKIKKYFNFKNEKGSITVFVLIAILFFTIVLTTLYARNMNILSSQNKNIETITNNYGRSVQEMDTKYQELVMKESSKLKNGSTFNTTLKKSVGATNPTVSTTDSKITTITFDSYANQASKVKDATAYPVDEDETEEKSALKAFILASNDNTGEKKRRYKHICSERNVIKL